MTAVKSTRSQNMIVSLAALGSRVPRRRLDGRRERSTAGVAEARAGGQSGVADRASGRKPGAAGRAEAAAFSVGVLALWALHGLVMGRL